MALQNTDLIKFVTYPDPIPNKFIILDHSWIRCQLCICAQVRSFMSLIAADIFTIDRKWKSTGAEYEGRRAATPAGKRCIGWVAKVELEKRNMGLGCTCGKTTLHYGYLFHGNIRLHSIFLLVYRWDNIDDTSNIGLICTEASARLQYQINMLHSVYCKHSIYIDASSLPLLWDCFYLCSLC